MRAPEHTRDEDGPAMFPIGDENEPGHGPALATLAIIALNVFVFLVLQGAGGPSGERFTYGYSAVPYEITHGTDLTQPTPISVDGQTASIPQEPGPVPIWLTLLTSMFMHGGWLHIGGNMLFLWVFGDNVEHRMGRIPYLGFYLLAGIVGSVAQILIAPNSTIPTLGASGAISGVLGAYLVLFPGNRVTVFVFRFITQVPALVAIGLWAALQVLSGISGLGAETAGGVAYFAHLGGLAAGFVAGLLVRVLGRGSGGSPRPMRG